jgi:flagellar hook-associated protein 3 FlgL
MRISQRTMYLDHIKHMNNTLAAYMESNMQGATEKQVNRPSDDPAGMARILMYRSSIADISQYQRNLNTAEGWLSLADNMLSDGDSGASNLISQIRVLAEQGATGHMTAQNRLQIAVQVRELFGSLLNLANTRYEGKSIFAGQDYSSSAYQEGMAVDCTGAAFQTSLDTALTANPPDWIRFSGRSESSILVRFTNGGGTASAGQAYDYTLDGGETWQTGTVALNAATGRYELALGEVVMSVPPGTDFPAFDPDDTAATQLLVRPTAVYQGADNRLPAQIVRKDFDSTIGLTASGVFSTDVQVRLDTVVPDWSTPGTDFTYSYSTDGGRTWTQRQGNTADPRLIVPGGYVTVSGPGGSDAGAELTVKPQRTDLAVQGDRDYFAVMNNVGKDIFGGRYMSLREDGQYVYLNAFDGGASNVFETVGRLIGALEINNQDGVQQALDDLGGSLARISEAAANVGARRNAIATIKEGLISNKNSQTEAMSRIEDVDLTELLTRLSQQQLAYQTVLKSSSMIMQMGLVNYL